MFGNMTQFIDYVNTNPDKLPPRDLELPRLQDYLPPSPSEGNHVAVSYRLKFATLGEYFDSITKYIDSHPPQLSMASTVTPPATPRLQGLEGGKDKNAASLSLLSTPSSTEPSSSPSPQSSFPSTAMSLSSGKSSWFKGFPVYSSEDLFPFGDNYWRQPSGRMRWWTGYFSR